MSDLTQSQLNEFNIILNSFNKLSNGLNEIEEKWILSVLPRCIPLFTHLTAKYKLEKIERITINKNILGSNKRIRNINFLKYPPSDKVKRYGRCNLKQQSIFYGSILRMTALSEMQPKTGDLITKSIWKLKESHDLKICPIFFIQPSNGTFNPKTDDLQQSFLQLVKDNYHGNTQEAVINLSKFIAYQFSKFVDSSNDRDYLFSAYFSNKLLYEFEDGTIEGILYPSVKEHLSFENIALRPDVFDRYYILDEVHESIVIKDPSDGEGGLLMSGINDCKNFDFETNEILWDDKIMQPEDRWNFYKHFYSIDLT